LTKKRRKAKTDEASSSVALWREKKYSGKKKVLISKYSPRTLTGRQKDVQKYKGLIGEHHQLIKERTKSTWADGELSLKEKAVTPTREDRQFQKGGGGTKEDRRVKSVKSKTKSRTRSKLGENKKKNATLRSIIGGDWFSRRIESNGEWIKRAYRRGKINVPPERHGNYFSKG